MPFYSGINASTTQGKRTIEGLLRLRAGLTAADIPQPKTDGNLVLGTWNLREFGTSKFGVRSEEPLFYIAEVLSRFDLVAVQEVRDNLAVLNRLLRILGGWWKVLLSDVTEGTAGNRERLAYLYDSRKISFGGLAGEIVLPPVKGADGKTLAEDQLARTPYLVGFRAGWFRFTICTTHVLYGESIKDDPRRVREINALARFLAARVGEKHAWARNMIILGDFNIFAPTDVTFDAIVKAGFEVPAALQQLPSNALKNKHYDQIAFIAPDIRDKLTLCKAGVFDTYPHVYRDEDEARYAAVMGEKYEKDKTGLDRTAKAKTTYYKTWRTFQMSDHLPMWIELGTDFSERYLLDKKKKGEGPEPPDM